MNTAHALLQSCVDAGRAAAPPLDAGTLATMVSAVQRGGIERLTPAEHAHWLAALLMTERPSKALLALRSVAGLRRFLPELEGLFGVPQLGDGPVALDVGEHQLRLLDVAAGLGAPLDIRFAGLAHKFGKAGTAPEIWPHHIRHEQRGRVALSALLGRSLWSAATIDLARLVIEEADHVHRVSDMRAGPIAQMLHRLRAMAQPGRFDRLLEVCACDYAAYPGHTAREYPKGPRLRQAFRAYASTPVDGLAEDAALEARAQAIDRLLWPRSVDAAGSRGA